MLTLNHVFPRSFAHSRILALARRALHVAEGMPPPLRGVRVVDLTRVLAAPTATMLLADLGADVIKIEEPKRGDDTRSWYPPAAPIADSSPEHTSNLPPESAYFLSSNRNKRSLGLDIKHPDGLRVMHKLIRSADVFVENFVPGKLASLGLGYEDCHKINKKLVYASITGYGQSGPFASYPGYDVVVEAEAGLMHITGDKEGSPCKVGVAVTDIATGLYAHGAIMAALISRQQTGKGVHIDCNLFDTQIACLANIASNFLVAGQEAGRHGTSHPSIVPYQVFPCEDGMLMIGAGNEKQFRTLVNDVLEKPTLAADPRYATNERRVANRIELVETIESILKKKPRDYWIKKFTGKGVPFGPINNISQTFNHPQAQARGITATVSHPRAGDVRLVAPAVMYNGQRMPITRHPPYLSEHADEILQDLGYDNSSIVQLRKEGVIR